jgi:cation transport protein ChaC
MASDGMDLRQSEAPLVPWSAESVPEIAACLGLRRDVWIFGYGSLMWNPGFAFCEAVPALLRGYHRRFCLYSKSYRGTPERPGVVRGLDRGGACRGVAFRVPAVDVEAALAYLWEREMSDRSYRMKELAVETPSGTVMARAFVVDPVAPNYAGRLGLEETARLILQGVGRRGPCRQYLENTVRQLEALGVVDGPLHRLEAKVREFALGLSPCGAAPL